MSQENELGFIVNKFTKAISDLFLLTDKKRSIYWLMIIQNARQIWDQLGS